MIMKMVIHHLMSAKFVDDKEKYFLFAQHFVPYFIDLVHFDYPMTEASARWLRRSRWSLALAIG